MLINEKFGDYVLLRRLAVGGQSEVYLGLKVGPRDYLRTIALKLLPSHLADDGFVELFFKEAFISSRLAHPHIITVHDAKCYEGTYFLVMDFVAGQTVAELAQRGSRSGRPLRLSHAIRIVADACDGLQYAHKFRDLDGAPYPIVHCDVSPQNLMVTYQGVTKVFDFGIAHVPGWGGAEAQPGVGGKYAYMSPEQIRGEPIDARSDIFSLGVILYELSTGYRLFRRASPAEVVRAVLEEPIRPSMALRPDLPAYLERCIARALERDPERRYQDAAQMRDDLLELLGVMTRGSERDELGAYVAELFTAERAAIAETLGQANRGGLDLGAGPADSSEPEIARARFVPFEEATLDLAAGRRPAGEPARAARADKIRRLERRQSMLWIVLLALAAASAALLALGLRS